MKDLRLWNPLSTKFEKVQREDIAKLHAFRNFHIVTIVDGIIYLGRPDADNIGTEVHQAYVDWCREHQ